MNNNTLHASALGRIWLMYRAEMRTIATTLLSIAGTIFFINFIYPRIPLIFNLNYVNFLIAYADSYDFSADASIAAIASSIYALWYANHRAFRSSPMPFALTPVGFWEKVVALVGVIASTWIVSQLVVLVCFVLEVAMVPGITWAEHFDYGGITIMLEAFSGSDKPEIGGHLASIFGSIAFFAMLTAYYCVMRIRNFSLGLISALILPSIVIFFVPAIAINQYIEYSFVSETLEQYVGGSTPPWRLMYYYEAYILLMIVGTSYLLYKRLRTLPS